MAGRWNVANALAALAAGLLLEQPLESLVQGLGSFAPSPAGWRPLISASRSP